MGHSDLNAGEGHSGAYCLLNPGLDQFYSIEGEKEITSHKEEENNPCKD